MKFLWDLAFYDDILKLQFSIRSYLTISNLYKYYFNNRKRLMLVNVNIPKLGNSNIKLRLLFNTCLGRKKKWISSSTFPFESLYWGKCTSANLNLWTQRRDRPRKHFLLLIELTHTFDYCFSSSLISSPNQKKKQKRTSLGWWRIHPFQINSVYK